MSKFVEIASALGALVMAATPLLAVGGVAHAAEPGMQTVRVSVGDLDLTQPRDITEFNHRVQTAARLFCVQNGVSGLTTMASCQQAVRAEVMEKLGPAQRESLVAAGAPAFARIAVR